MVSGVSPKSGIFLFLLFFCHMHQPFNWLNRSMGSKGIPYCPLQLINLIGWDRHYANSPAKNAQKACHPVGSSFS